MNAGQFVFPLSVAGAFVVLATFVASNPAQPVERDLSQVLLRVEPGDTVWVELTGYYGDQPYVFLSTQEERWSKGELDSLMGSSRAQLQGEPLQYRLAPAGAAGVGPLDAMLIGARVNRTFTTPQFTPAQGFGEWEESRDFNRTFGPLPLLQSYDAMTQLPTGGTFNLTRYLQFWATEGYPNLREGSLIPCEGTEGWMCRIETIDPANGSFTYRRNVKDGDEIPFQAAFGRANVPVPGTAIVSVDGPAAAFDLTWSPPVGVRFQLRQALLGFLPAGTFLVDAFGDQTLTARYSSATDSPAHLVGEVTWYDVVVVRIQRPEASS